MLLRERLFQSAAESPQPPSLVLAAWLGPPRGTNLRWLPGTGKIQSLASVTTGVLDFCTSVTPKHPAPVRPTWVSVQGRDAPSVAPSWAASISASPRPWFEMHILRPGPTPPTLRTAGRAPPEPAKRPFPGASPFAQVSVAGAAGECASSRDFRAAGLVVTCALGRLPSSPASQPRVFKRKGRLRVKSSVIFAAFLAPGPVESQCAPLRLGSRERRSCENRRWKLAAGGEEAAGEPGRGGTAAGCDGLPALR